MQRSSLFLASVLFLLAAVLSACNDDGSGGQGSIGGVLPPTSTIDGGPSTIDGGPRDAAPDGGGPIAVDPRVGLPTSALLDLGSGDCGSILTRTLAFENSGGQELDLALATDAPFTIAPTTAKVAPGASASITLTVAIPPSATAGVAIHGSIVLHTNDPVVAEVTLPVTATPQGATFVIDGTPTKADFGTAPLGVKAPDIQLVVKNAGNVPATVTFDAPADAQFTVSPAGTGVTLDPDAGAVVTTRFTPTTTTLSASSSALHVTGVVCGASLAKLDLSGQGVTGAVAGWPTSPIDFGAATCGGAAPAPQTFTLTNGSSTDVTLTAISASTKGYTLDAAAGAKVPAKGSLAIKITPPAVPAPSAIPGSYGETITFTTDAAGDTSHAVDVALAARGGVLALDTSATAGFGTFAATPVDTTTSQPFIVKNTGNAAVDVIASTASPFGVSQGSFTLAAGDSVNLNATFRPTAAADATGSLVVSAASGLCQPAPAPITLGGTGTMGGIAVSTSALLFQPTCGTQAAAKTFTVQNSGTAPMTWTGTLGKAGLYTVSPSSGTVAPQDLVLVTVTPKAIPDGSTSPDVSVAVWADTFTITTDIAGDTAHAVTLNQNVLGAVLALTAPSGVAFPDTANGAQSGPLPFALVNAGNASATGGAGSTVSATLHSANPAFFFSDDANVSVASASTSTVHLRFAPTGVTAATDFTSAISVTLTPGQALCAPLPAPLTATGHVPDPCAGVDFQTDVNNCGACGHYCLGGSCITGQCVNGDQIELSANNVYWRVFGTWAPTDYDGIWSAPKGTHPGTRLITSSDVDVLTVQQETLVWAAADGIYTAPLGGGPPAKLASLQGDGGAGVHVRDIAVGASAIYWAEGDDNVGDGTYGGVYQVSRTNGQVTTLVPNQNAALVSADATYVYWFVGTPNNVLGAWGLSRKPLAGGSVEVLESSTAQSNLQRHGILFSGGAVFVRDWSSVYRWTSAGGFTTFWNKPSEPAGWILAGSDGVFVDSNSLWKIPVGGDASQATSLGPSFLQGDLTMDATDIYELGDYTNYLLESKTP